MFFSLSEDTSILGRIIHKLILVNQIDTTLLYDFGSWRQRWHNRQVGFLHVSTYAHFVSLCCHWCGWFVTLTPEHPVTALMSGLWLLNLDKFLHSLERAVGCVGKAHVWVGNSTFHKTTWIICPVFPLLQLQFREILEIFLQNLKEHFNKQFVAES